MSDKIPARRRKYQVVDGDAVASSDGGIVYDFLDSKQQAEDICKLLNEGVGPEWDAVRPKLEAMVAARKAIRRA